MRDIVTKIQDTRTTRPKTEQNDTTKTISCTNSATTNAGSPNTEVGVTKLRNVPPVPPKPAHLVNSIRDGDVVLRNKRAAVRATSSFCVRDTRKTYDVGQRVQNSTAIHLARSKSIMVKPTFLDKYRPKNSDVPENVITNLKQSKSFVESKSVNGIFDSKRIQRSKDFAASSTNPTRPQSDVSQEINYRSLNRQRKISNEDSYIKRLTSKFEDLNTNADTRPTTIAPNKQLQRTNSFIETEYDDIFLRRRSDTSAPKTYCNLIHRVRKPAQGNYYDNIDLIPTSNCSSVNTDDIEAGEYILDSDYDDTFVHVERTDVSEHDYDDVGGKNINGNLTCNSSKMATRLSKIVQPLWQESNEVMNCGILDSLTTSQKNLQEAKFEILSSESSFLVSMNILCHHFLKEIDAAKVLSDSNRQILFGNVNEIKNCSQNFLDDLSECWENSIFLDGICEIIRKHAEHYFDTYVTYCENHIFRDELLHRLRQYNNAFIELIENLEADSMCKQLPFSSYLLLPMQRITRLPLVTEALLKQLDPNDDEYTSCKEALEMLRNVVVQCNEGAKYKQQEHEFIKIWKMLELPYGMLPLNSNMQRYFEKKTTFIQYTLKGDNTYSTSGRKFSKKIIYLFLFTDILIVAKQKSAEFYAVLHYCPRHLVEINLESTDLFSTDEKKKEKSIILLTLLENQEMRTIEMTLECTDANEICFWKNAFVPPQSPYPGVTMYTSWSSPRFVAHSEYKSNVPNGLDLRPGEIINVSQKSETGWLYGKSESDGQTGWFPEDYVHETDSEHHRAQNLKQRHRVLSNIAKLGQGP